MAELIENASLKNLNTFGLDVKARYLFRFHHISELTDLLKDNKYSTQKRLILGGGSNILFLNDFDGLVIQPLNDTIKETETKGKFTWLKTGSGMEWDGFVEYCSENELGGAENLSLIPGHTGASTVQNIGAFGVEASDIISSVEIYNLETAETFSINSKDCNFGYRDSIFKHELKDKYLVTSLTYKLTNKDHSFITSYGDLKKILDETGDISIKSIRNAVIKIRESKLPDPKISGNAGSFFKNPVIPVALLEKISQKYAGIPVYPAGEGFSKVAAGWLIDQAGWKGKSKGNAGVHDKQALVLINPGKANGKEIELLAEDIRKSVYDLFGVLLEPEVIFIG
ncbi:MAG: UDP-N-acetylenolpyruvoylglucosamine reductase [Bacteroidetes bacterium GWF2_38_335]|nr:MAG: UDP-N-acetylenolpyruvoylglucosamine reductase [Bacteroidetes bacterium GWF2_38_335]OFY78705.1 MAG: UDP-N-acetylenolpyruvoylglucosamine reductase [Bacteroidetes bacterium RIFOXYA12_FULL_38_20]HBS88465.1 UDP-N-acetylenolpyruvoylglucosamine reductase [Bacteroidales bacterium]